MYDGCIIRINKRRDYLSLSENSQDKARTDYRLLSLQMLAGIDRLSTLFHCADIELLVGYLREQNKSYVPEFNTTTTTTTTTKLKREREILEAYPSIIQSFPPPISP